jgi:hypothetical protein
MKNKIKDWIEIADEDIVSAQVLMADGRINFSL